MEKIKIAFTRSLDDIREKAPRVVLLIVGMAVVVFAARGVIELIELV